MATAAKNLELERPDFLEYQATHGRKRNIDDDYYVSTLDRHGKFQLGYQRDYGDQSRGNQSRQSQGNRSY